MTRHEISLLASGKSVNRAKRDVRPTCWEPRLAFCVDNNAFLLAVFPFPASPSFINRPSESKVEQREWRSQKSTWPFPHLNRFHVSNPAVRYACFNDAKNLSNEILKAGWQRFFFSLCIALCYIFTIFLTDKG